MASTSYSIVIAATNGAAPKDGFIDSKRIEYYLPANGSPLSGLTYDLCKAKRRANLRYTALVAQMDVVANVYVTEVTAPAATGTTPATSLTLAVTVERGAEALVTRDELTAGAILTGTAALKRAVARALIWGQTRNVDVLDPTPTAAKGTTVQVARFGHRIAPLEVGPLANDLTAAEALVTVTQTA